MNGIIPLIIDGGEVGIGIESTIVDMTGSRPCLLRPGIITTAMLSETVGDIDIDPSIEGVMDPDSHPKAPGMKYKHYAPKGELYIVHGERNTVIRKINALAEENRAKGLKTAVIATEETLSSYSADLILSVGKRSEEETIAHNLFSVLRTMDEENADIIYSEEFDTPGIGQAVMNRLIRAAGHKVIEAGGIVE
jgi:L-threonylcarbamoyladenylate synthase